MCSAFLYGALSQVETDHSIEILSLLRAESPGSFTAIGLAKALPALNSAPRERFPDTKIIKSKVFPKLLLTTKGDV
jgi:hypothetical protein